MKACLSYGVTHGCSQQAGRQLSGLWACVQVHRIPIVDQSAKVVGIVTRTDIFNALGA